MRILVCAEEAPLEPVTGFRAALGALVERLRSAHEVRVLAYRMPDQRDGGADGMRLVPRASPTALETGVLLARALARRRPLRVDALAAGLAAPLQEELARFNPDVVHVTAGRLAGLGALLEGRGSVLGALDAAHLNVEARSERGPWLRRRLLRGEATRWKRFEGEDWRSFGAVTVVSAEDAAALRELDARLAVRVIPLGIEADRFAPSLGVSRDPNRLLFHGVLDYAPNVTALQHLVRRVLPIVRARRPDAHLVAVGRSPGPEVVALGDAEGVTIVADVPDVVPWLSGASVYVCPMRSGTGVKNKLLEAMANERACVATPLATRGLGAVDGRHLLVGRSEGDIAAHVLRVLDDAALARRLGIQARALVVSEHDWGGIARAYESLYSGLAARELTARGER